MALPLPLLEWGADEASGDALDSSGHGRPLTVSSASGVSRVAGRNGSGLQQISAVVSEGPSLTGLQTANRSVAFDLRVNVAGSFWVMEYKAGDLASGSGSWGLLLLSSTLRWRAKDASGSIKEITLPIDLGNWHHIVVTHDGVTLKLYRDGALFGSIALAGAIQTADHFVPFDLAGSAATLDNVRIYDVALTPAQVTEVAATPVGTTAPSEDHSATLALSGSSSLALAASIGLSAPVALSGSGSTLPSGAPATGFELDMAAIGSLMMGQMVAGLEASLPMIGTGSLPLFPAPEFDASMSLMGTMINQQIAAWAEAVELALSGVGRLDIAGPRGEIQDLTLTASLEPAPLFASVEALSLKAVVEHG